MAVLLMTNAEEDGSTGDVGINNLPPAVLHTVFSCLGPRDLCAVSCTCTLWRKLNRDHVSNRAWKHFYTSRWYVTPPVADNVCWQSKYGSKMKQGKSWTGKYEHDSLYGHKAGVKALKLLPSHGILLTGSLDRTVRLWDLKYGMPLSISAAHGGTVRSVALDAQLVASGSSDNVVRLWHARGSVLDSAASLLDGSFSPAATGPVGLADGLQMMEMDGPADTDDQIGATISAAAAAVSSSSGTGLLSGIPLTHGPYSVVTGEADETLFDLSQPAQQLRGHIGPVTSLCLTETCLYSGSWDYTVRCWSRSSWDCISVLKYQDWVWGVVARGGLLLVASGPEVHVHDLPTGKLVRKFQNLHEGNVSCVEGTHSGNILFTGGADGLLMAHDLRMKESSRVLWHHNANVHGLALEDPWMASTAADGTVVMHNYESAMPNNLGIGSVSSNSNLPTRRSLTAPGHSGPLYCVDLADSWLAAGGESPTVRIWDFTKAAEAAARAAAAKAARNNAKQAAKQRRAAAAAARTGQRKEAADHAGSRGTNAIGFGNRKGCAVGHGSSSSGKCNAQSAAAPPVPAAGSSSAAAALTAVAGDGSNRSSSSRPRGLLSAAATAFAAAADGRSGSLASSSSDRCHRMQHSRGEQHHIQQHTGNAQHNGGSSHGRSLYVYSTTPQQQWHGSSPQQHWYSSSPQQQQYWHGHYSGSPQYQHHWHGRYGASPQQQYGQSQPCNGWQPNSHRRHIAKQPRHHPGSSNNPRAARGSDFACGDCGGVLDEEDSKGIPIPSSIGSHNGRTNRNMTSVQGKAQEHRKHGPADAAVLGKEGLSDDATRVSSAEASGNVAAHKAIACSSSYPVEQSSLWLAGGARPGFQTLSRHAGRPSDHRVPSGDQDEVGEPSGHAARPLTVDAAIQCSLSG